MGNALSNNNKVTSQDRAILNLKLQRDRLHQYQRRISTVLSAETDAAKSLLAKGDKPRALLALRRRKFQENLLAQTDAQLATLEQLVSSIEFALVEKDVYFGLKQGSEVLKQINKEMSLESVERLMEESQEGIRYQKEISEMLGSVMSNEMEDEVEEEMERLERELRGEVAVEDLPEVPKDIRETEEEKVRKAKERAKARAKAREEERAREEEGLVAA
ncbi:SNF7 family protein [Pyronema omphalodes]|nr:SNF7 family protein [Pyronema omphalodes]